MSGIEKVMTEVLSSAETLCGATLIQPSSSSIGGDGTICTGRRKMRGQIYSSCKTIKSVLMFISCNFVCLNEEGLKFLHREEGATERWIPPVYVSQPFLVSDMPMKALVTVH